MADHADGCVSSQFGEEEHIDVCGNCYRVVEWVLNEAQALDLQVSRAIKLCNSSCTRHRGQ